MIYFLNKNSKQLHDSLLKISYNSYTEILIQAQDSSILVMDNVTSSNEFTKLSRKIKEENFFCIFKKDDLVFLGPFMESSHDACPFCLLLTLAIDTANVRRLSNKSKKKIDVKKKINFLVKDIKETIHCINIVDKSVKYLKKPLAHPGCSHYVSLKKTDILRENLLSTSELRDILKNKYTGLIRQIISLKDLASKELTRKMGSYEVLLSRFQNPVFHLYPRVGFLDTAVGSDFSFNTALTKIIFETIERYSVLTIPKSQPDKIGTYKQLEGKAINPDRFWKYDSEQLLKNEPPFKNIKKSSRLRWRKVFSPIFENMLVPEDFIYINFEKPSLYHNNTTSGCAADINIDNACLRAVLELIERDNVMRHWAKGESMPQFDLSTAKGEIKKNIDFVNNLGFDIKIINCSRLESVYTFIIFLINKSASRPRVMITSACALDPEEAILKGFNEAIGGILISLVLEETTKPRYLKINDIEDPRDHANYYRDPKTFKVLKHFYETSGTFSLADLKNKNYGDNTLSIVKNLLLHLKRLGIDVYFIDQTFFPFKKFGIKVIRAVSPELMPLVFGTGMLKLGGTKSELFKYAEIATRYPHPYA